MALPPHSRLYFLEKALFEEGWGWGEDSEMQRNSQGFFQVPANLFLLPCSQEPGWKGPKTAGDRRPSSPIACTLYKEENETKSGAGICSRPHSRSEMELGCGVWALGLFPYTPST